MRVLHEDENLNSLLLSHREEISNGDINGLIMEISNHRDIHHKQEVIDKVIDICLDGQLSNGDALATLDMIKYSLNGKIPSYIFHKKQLKEREIDIPDGITSIGLSSFLLTNINSVKIPASVKEIGLRAFAWCAVLREVEFEPGSLITKIPISTFYSCQSLQHIDLPDSVRVIDEYAFCLSGLTSFTVPPKVKTISKSAFNTCRNLSQVDFTKAQVKTVDIHAFAGTGFLDLELPEGLIRIRDRAFLLCQQLRSIYIPESVSYMGNNVFEDCSNLEVIKCKADSYALQYASNLKNSGRDIKIVLV